MFKKAVNNEKGVALILVAISIIVLFGLGALAIDVGHLYNVKNQLQAAADAAALAGAAELDDSNVITQDKARDAAQRIAALNFADVASETVPALPPFSLGAQPGSPIPVALNRGQTEDIEVGYWDGTGFTPGPATAPNVINAVRAHANRGGAQGTAQPQANNWFAKVFSLLPGGLPFNLSSIGAVAIAAKDTGAPFVPIAVNEYWDEQNKNGVLKEGNPYNQKYPESFMRSVNANESHDAFNPNNINQNVGTRALGGVTFAIIGTNANGNNSAFDVNSFVDILHRNRFHNGRQNDPGGTSTCGNSTTAWFSVRTDSSGTCSDCCGNLLALDSVTEGDVNPTKFDDNFSYLFTGVPDNVIAPSAVREIIRTTPIYPENNYDNTVNFNDPSNCPYASIPYFAGSGGSPVNKKLDLENDPFNGNRFYEVYPKGSRIIVMVYDGTHFDDVVPAANSNGIPASTFLASLFSPSNAYAVQPTDPGGGNGNGGGGGGGGGPTQAKVVTVVGYGVIEIDGYLNGNFNGNPDSLNPGGTGKGGGTVYGHAIEHGLTVDASIADTTTDKFLIQPPDQPANATSASARKGTCDFSQIVKELKKKFGTSRVHLVGTTPDLKYGMAAGHH